MRSRRSSGLPMTTTVVAVCGVYVVVGNLECIGSHQPLLYQAHHITSEWLQLLNGGCECGRAPRVRLSILRASTLATNHRPAPPFLSAQPAGGRALRTALVWTGPCMFACCTWVGPGHCPLVVRLPRACVHGACMREDRRRGGPMRAWEGGLCYICGLCGTYPPRQTQVAWRGSTALLEDTQFSSGM